MEIKEATSRINTFVELWDLEQADEEIQMIVYKEDIEAFKVIIEVLEKQMPKKIFHQQWVGIEGVPYDLCPNCKTNLCTNGRFPSKKENYCASCGQKLDWSK